MENAAVEKSAEEDAGRCNGQSRGQVKAQGTTVREKEEETGGEVCAAAAVRNSSRNAPTTVSRPVRCQCASLTLLQHSDS